jgi:exosortase
MITRADAQPASTKKTTKQVFAAGNAGMSNDPSGESVGLVRRIFELLPDVFPYVLAAAFLLFTTWPMLTWWYWEFTRPESYYAHGPLVPFMAAFMLWHQRTRLKAVEKKPFWPALLLLAPMLVLLVVSVKEEMRSVESLSFLGTVWASTLLVLGTKFFKAASFPLLFLILMAPLPAPLLNDSTLHLQMWSTDLASKILAVTGFGNTQIGNVIHIDNYTLFVDVPCSGFKTLLALLTFNAFLAFMLDGPLIRRLLLFLICSPLALLINGVRIALIGMVGECISSEAAHVFHDYSGIITLVLGFILLFTIARTLRCRKFAGWDIF